MEKGKLGFRLSFYAVLAFIFVLLGQPLLLAAWFAFVAVYERDAWTTRQCMEALLLGLLTLAADLLRTVIYTVQSLLGRLFPVYDTAGGDDILGFMDFMGGTTRSAFPTLESLLALVGLALTVAIYVFAIVGAVRTARGHSAHIPLVHRWADWAWGLVTPKPPKPTSHTDYLVHGEAAPEAGEAEAAQAEENAE